MENIRNFFLCIPQCTALHLAAKFTTVKVTVAEGSTEFTRIARTKYQSFLYLQRLHPNPVEHKQLKQHTAPAIVFNTVSFAHRQEFVDTPEITYQQSQAWTTLRKQRKAYLKTERQSPACL